jgi:4'-phosphopantetheinyl transferase
LSFLEISYKKLRVMVESNLVIENSSIYIWCLSLTSPPLSSKELYSVLSANEKKRANQYHFNKDKNSYITRTGVLRHILAQYAQVLPKDLYFQTNEFGKPSLCGAPGKQMAFNLSHSDQKVLIAVAESSQEVGVDIEKIRSMEDLYNIVESYFSGPEKRIIQDLPEAERAEGFFRYWTRKEAYIKAVGQGLSHPLNTFSTHAEDGIVRFSEDQQQKPAWHFEQIEVAPGYCAAAVSQGSNWQVQRCEWPGLTQPKKMTANAGPKPNT